MTDYEELLAVYQDLIRLIRGAGHSPAYLSGGPQDRGYKALHPSCKHCIVLQNAEAIIAKATSPQNP